MADYYLRVSSENDIPHDVLVEHIAVALRDFQFAGKVNVDMRTHPFEGPVVFDDEPENVDELTALDPFPNVTRAIDDLKAARNGG